MKASNSSWRDQLIQQMPPHLAKELDIFENEIALKKQGKKTALLLVALLRRVRDVVLTMLPVMLSGLLTFATCAALDLPLNFTNIIALPLLFGVGVAFNIYFVLAWRAGETAMLQSSLMRALFTVSLLHSWPPRS